MDPITFEILRHRLWMINDEQGKIAVRISGSPLVYEVKDFSASLLTAQGDSLFIGPHVTRLSIALHAITKTVVKEFASMGINDGDMFFTNDPWAGTAHHNDQAVVAPVVALELLRWVSHRPVGDWLIGLPFFTCSALQFGAALIAWRFFRGHRELRAHAVGA